MPSTLPAPPDPESPKAAWRSWAAGIDRSVWSAQVADRLLAWPPLHGVVAQYLGMPGEVDLDSLDSSARMRMLVPRTEAGGMLTLHDLNKRALVRHPFGFWEPDSASTPVDVNDVDVVLVPGTVFDRNGARIGRGAGMYDRLLNALPAGVMTVGVTVDDLVVDEVPSEPHDQRVDWLATESGVRLTDRSLSARTEAVVEAAVAVGMAPAMVHFPEGTRTSRDAARAVDAELGSIAKSLVFLVDDDPTLVICSGDHRVSETKLAAHFGAATARPAPLDVVRSATGFVAGGTPAVGHASVLEVVADTSLCRYRWVWSAGGTPDTVYPVSLERLIAASGARWADVSERG